MDSSKDLVRRIYEEALNKRDLEVLDELVAENYIENDPLPGQGTGRDGMKDRYRMLVQALDPQFTIEDVIAEGDRVAVRWSNSGSHVGELFGIPPTGRSFSIAGVDIYRLQGGTVVEHWDVVDMYGLMMQLGLLPPPE